MSSCRSCHARIRWAMTPQGKRIPVDAEPVENGNLALHVDVSLDLVAVPVAPGQTFIGDDGKRYVAHFATCDDPARWRKPR
jgi:hypothetical protein